MIIGEDINRNRLAKLRRYRVSDEKRWWSNIVQSSNENLILSRLERDLYSRKDKEGVDIREWLKADIRSWPTFIVNNPKTRWIQIKSRQDQIYHIWENHPQSVWPFSWIEFDNLNIWVDEKRWYWKRTIFYDIPILSNLFWTFNSSTNIRQNLFSFRHIFMVFWSN